MNIYTLLDITISTNVILLTCGSLVTIGLAFMAFVWSILQGNSRELMTKLDEIIEELKPLGISVAIHDEKISQLKEEVNGHSQWMRVYDTELQKLIRERGNLA